MSVPEPTAPPPMEWRGMSTTFPPGLLSLMPLDRIFIYRQPDGIEALRTWEYEKEYQISDVNGELLYIAIEESDWCSRCCLGKCRSWHFHVIDKNHHEMMRISRTVRCSSCCFPCCLQQTTIYAQDQLLGSVKQNWNAWRPSFTILDSLDSPVLLIKGPICMWCIGDVDFHIRSIDKQHKVGMITKKWSGISQRLFDDGSSFDISFPIDLDLKMKAVLIGACFLIDFIYFEERSNLHRLNDINEINRQTLTNVSNVQTTIRNAHMHV